MGIEYKASVAFGFSVLGESPGGFTHEQWYDGDVDKWIQSREGTGQLITDTGG